jgi:cytochrome c553
MLGLIESAHLRGSTMSSLSLSASARRRAGIFEADGLRCRPPPANAFGRRAMQGMIGAVFGLSLSAFPAMAQTLPDTIAQRTVACTACHGNEGRAASDGFYPRIAGKPAGYLYNQLLNFREGRRRYPLMIYMVDHLSDDYLHEIATYFSSLNPPYPAPQAASAPPSVLARGKQLVRSGDTAQKVPACVGCHGDRLTGMLPSIPGLLGLPRDYLNAQFGAWKNGARHAAAPDCMAQIVRRLSDQDISAAIAWLAAQPLPADTAPAAAMTAKLPLPCGSFPQ